MVAKRAARLPISKIILRVLYCLIPSASANVIRHIAAIIATLRMIAFRYISV